ncbi:polysaccharide biosynthesis tyrosine autokinase [Nocardioides sp. URHA0020]|uniref:polysaccharide biosynthesis tyrosine autokinase n=1 Tax=Nocardioides sp. URHA0020 TaxID=1380392 RepID=UPI00048D0B69|nr:polysaccharide biosynthesis tyrosine autokinase [Nocardioides sp. URHA0020]
MELGDYLRLLRRRWLTIAVVACIVFGGVVAYTLAVTPVYQSSTRLFVTTQTSDTASDLNQGGLFSAQRVSSYADLVASRDLATAVIDRLGLDLTPDELIDNVSATVVPETVNLKISYSDPSPREAQAIAQGYAESLVDLVRQLETPVGTTDAPIKATIVDAASLPTDPLSPRVARNLALGLVLGLLLGVGAALLRDLLDTTVKSEEDIAQKLDAPILGGIAFDGSARQRPLVTSLEPHAPRVEAFRVLRTNLQFVEVDSAHKVFVVTSAVPEEGKSTTSVNLAITMAQAGHKTLLIEGDLRRPKATSSLGLDNAVGITTLLVGKVKLEDAIQRYAEADLDVLASGAVPPNPAELLQSNAMAQLLDRLRSEYEVIIVDAPPLLPVTDAALLASQADGAIIVVRFGKTTKDQLGQAVQRLQQVDVSPVGVVLNMVPNKRRHGYGYGYGYGYAPEEARPND